MCISNGSFSISQTMNEFCTLTFLTNQIRLGHFRKGAKTECFRKQTEVLQQNMIWHKWIFSEHYSRLKNKICKETKTLFFFFTKKYSPSTTMPVESDFLKLDSIAGTVLLSSKWVGWAKVENQHTVGSRHGGTSILLRKTAGNWKVSLGLESTGWWLTTRYPS